MSEQHPYTPPRPFPVSKKLESQPAPPSHYRELTPGRTEARKDTTRTDARESKRLRAFALDSASRCFTGAIEAGADDADVIIVTSDVLKMAQYFSRYIETGHID